MKKLIVLFVSLFIWTQGVNAEVGCAEAEAFMSDIGEKVIDLLTNKSISDEQEPISFEKF